MKRLPLVLTSALILLLAACSNEAPASPELTGQWAGSVNAMVPVPVEFEIGEDGHVFEQSFELTHEGETLAVDVSSHADGRSIHIIVTATHTNGDRLDFVLNGAVDGDTLSGDYSLTVLLGGDSASYTGSFTFTRVSDT